MDSFRAVSLTLIGDSSDESVLGVEDRVHHTHFQSVPGGGRAARKHRVLRAWPTKLRQIDARRAGGLVARGRVLGHPRGGDAGEGQREGGGARRRQQQQVGRRQHSQHAAQHRRLKKLPATNSRGVIDTSLLARQGKQTAKQSQVPDSTGHAVARRAEVRLNCRRRRRAPAFGGATTRAYARLRQREKPPSLPHPLGPTVPLTPWLTMLRVEFLETKRILFYQFCFNVN